MKLIQLADDIHLYKDFITEEECKNVINLLEYLNTLEDGYWKGISFYESYSARYPDVNDPILSKFNLTPTWFLDLKNRFKQAVADLANIPVEKVSNIGFHMQKWEPGAFANMHSDNSDNDGNMGAFTRSRYAAFLYLNDDFEGGILHFKDTNQLKGLDIIPKTGSFAVFHGGHKNMHEVTIVKKKPRYTIGSFWDDREENDYPEETRKAWAEELAKTRAMQKEENEMWKNVRNEGFRLDKQGQKYPAKEVVDINE